jgi:hypothetical protein
MDVPREKVRWCLSDSQTRFGSIELEWIFNLIATFASIKQVQARIDKIIE